MTICIRWDSGEAHWVMPQECQTLCLSSIVQVRPKSENDWQSALPVGSLIACWKQKLWKTGQRTNACTCITASLVGKDSFIDRLLQNKLFYQGNRSQTMTAISGRPREGPLSRISAKIFCACRMIQSNSLVPHFESAGTVITFANDRKCPIANSWAEKEFRWFWPSWSSPSLADHCMNLVSCSGIHASLVSVGMTRNPIVYEWKQFNDFTVPLFDRFLCISSGDRNAAGNWNNFPWECSLG
jgi:hypothetical protein